MRYDLIIIGGGLAGACLAKVMAEHGSDVLLLEKENQYKDRVRGEILLPWGVAEAKNLGIYNSLLEQCAFKVEGWSKYTEAGQLINRRHLASSNPYGASALGFDHAAMQSLLLAEAMKSGATVKRGITVTGLIDSEGKTLVLTRKKQQRDNFSARLVVGADGRLSNTDKWAGFTRQHDSKRILITGLQMKALKVATDSAHLIVNSNLGQLVSSFPIGNNCYRIYFARFKNQPKQTDVDGTKKLSGTKHISQFIQACEATGTPTSWFQDAIINGPLATFEASPHWVDTPYKDGVVLIGDAAATSDPTWGCGMSLALRDVRVLRDKLLATQDYHQAARNYAQSHDLYFGSLHRLESWMTDMFLAQGSSAEAARSQAMPNYGLDPSRIPDLVGLGPDAASDERARQRFFGEI